MCTSEFQCVQAELTARRRSVILQLSREPRVE